MRILVVGASGYVGGRLAARLLEHGPARATGQPGSARPGRALPGGRRGPRRPAATPADAAGRARGRRAWPTTWRTRWPAARPASSSATCVPPAPSAALRARLASVTSSTSAASATLTAGCRRISPAARQVGAELAAHGVPVTEFRAAVIIGSGSASFELLRSLVEHLPVMITPRWVRTLCQPIAIRDVLDYLVAAADHPERAGVVEIGGPDVLSYAEMMRTYARLRGMRRLMIPVPVLTPRLSSYWCSLVTPVPGAIARPLIEGLRNEVVVRDPEPAPPSASTPRPSSWPCAGPSSASTATTSRPPGSTRWASPVAQDLAAERSREGMIVDRQHARGPLQRPSTFAQIERLGGTAAGPTPTASGGSVACWTASSAAPACVSAAATRSTCASAMPSTSGAWRRCDRPELLRLRAEMKVPGRAWLQYEVSGDETSSRVVQTAFFEPRGLSGLLYWYALLPAHLFIFRGTIREVARRAEQRRRRPRRRARQGAGATRRRRRSARSSLPRLRPARGRAARLDASRKAARARSRPARRSTMGSG